MIALAFPVASHLALGILLNYKSAWRHERNLPANQDQHLRAIEALYSGHHGWLYATLKRKLGNAMDAADLAQDTFAASSRPRSR